MKQFFIADAFTTGLFGGNPAGVVIMKPDEPFPDDEAMRKIAAELRYSETAFIRPLTDAQTAEAAASMCSPGRDVSPDGGFQIRYFTPTEEVDLCGHATIASYHCLTEAGLCKIGGTYLSRALAGDLLIDVSEDGILMDMAVPAFIAEISGQKELEELYAVMGIEYHDTGMLPQLISTGLPDIMMPVASREILSSIAPDFPALAKLSEKYEVVGVHAFAPGEKGGDVTAYCRNFAPLVGIDEEAATGTSNGALTYYLVRNGLAAEGSFRYIQGEAMGRPSEIRAAAFRDGDDFQIRVGGSAVILANGRINI